MHRKCDNHQSWIDFETKTFICVRTSKTNSNCPENFPYKYKTSCLTIYIRIIFDSHCIIWIIL